MQPFKRGDIVKQENAGSMDFFHVEYAHENGALDTIADLDGKPAGLSVNSGGVMPATMAELLENRARRAARVPVLEGAELT